MSTLAFAPKESSSTLILFLLRAIPGVGVTVTVSVVKSTPAEFATALTFTAKVSEPVMSPWKPNVKFTTEPPATDSDTLAIVKFGIVVTNSKLELVKVVDASSVSSISALFKFASVSTAGRVAVISTSVKFILTSSRALSLSASFVSASLAIKYAS